MTFVTGLPLHERERPRQRSIAESASAVKDHADKKKNKSSKLPKPAEPKARDNFYFRRGSQAEAQASQKIATKRYGPHDYD